MIPKHKTYIELFAGSSSIFFNKSKADINILNDLDKEIYTNLKLLKKAPINILTYPQLTDLASFKIFFKNKIKTIQEKLLYYKIKTYSGFRSNPVIKESEIYRTFDITKWLSNLLLWKEKLKNTIITNFDYETIIKKYNTKDAFFFIDPPYENTNERFGYAESNLDYNKLLKNIKNIKGKFLMTINNSTVIRKLFKDFIIIENNVNNQWFTKDIKTSSKIRKELIITNY